MSIKCLINLSIYVVIMRNSVMKRIVFYLSIFLSFGASCGVQDPITGKAPSAFRRLSGQGIVPCPAPLRLSCEPEELELMKIEFSSPYVDISGRPHNPAPHTPSPVNFTDTIIKHSSHDSTGANRRRWDKTKTSVDQVRSMIGQVRVIEQVPAVPGITISADDSGLEASLLSEVDSPYSPFASRPRLDRSPDPVPAISTPSMARMSLPTSSTIIESDEEDHATSSSIVSPFFSLLDLPGIPVSRDDDSGIGNSAPPRARWDRFPVNPFAAQTSSDEPEQFIPTPEQFIPTPEQFIPTITPPTALSSAVTHLLNIFRKNKVHPGTPAQVSQRSASAIEIRPRTRTSIPRKRSFFSRGYQVGDTPRAPEGFNPNPWR